MSPTNNVDELREPADLRAPRHHAGGVHRRPDLWTSTCIPTTATGRSRPISKGARPATVHVEYRLIARDGRVVWFSDSAIVVRDADGDPLYVHGVMLDITERKEAEEQVAFLAYHDKLTGLPNRAMFEELLDLAIARARRHDLGVGGPARGPRQLQARERLPGPRGGRRVDPRARGAFEGGHARDRPGGASGRRRVPAAAGRHRAAGPPVASRLASATQSAERVAEASRRPCGRRSCWPGTEFTSARASASACSRGCGGRRGADGATPTRRCTGARGRGPAGTRCLECGGDEGERFALSLAAPAAKAVEHEALAAALPADRPTRRRRVWSASRR